MLIGVKRQLSQGAKALVVAGFAIAVVLSAASTCLGQDTQSQKRGFTPGGSFALSDIETINTVNGNMILNFPLGRLPAGRGGASAGINLFYNSKLYDTFAASLPDDSGLITSQNLLQASESGNWRYGFDFQARLINRLDQYDDPPQCPDGHAIYIWKVQVIFPDGGAHEFRPLGYTDAYGDGYFTIRPDGWQTSCAGTTPSVTTGMTYYSTDGTYMRLFFPYTTNSDWFGNWTLSMPDGNRVITDQGLERIYDRNSNYVEIQHLVNYNGTLHPATKVVDQLGRSTAIEFDYAARQDYIYSSGINGEQLKWTVKWKTIYVNRGYRTTGATGGQTRGGTSWQSLNNYGLNVVERITLPVQAGNLAYVFGYNGNDAAVAAQSLGFGELTSITLPSQALSSYQYRLDSSTPPTSGQFPNTDWVLKDYPISKTLSYQAEYDGTTSPASESWQYVVNPTSSTITAPDGGVTTETHGSTAYPNPDSGLNFSTTRPDGSVVEHIWQQNIPYGAPTNVGVNHFIKTEFTSIKDALGNPSQTAIKDYSYDKNGNVTQVREYDWVGYGNVPRDINGRPTGIPGTAPLKRVTTNTYSRPTPDAADTISNTADCYWNYSSPNLRNAVAASEVSDGTQTLSRAEFIYDDPTTTGNLTQKKSWDSTKGAYTNPLGPGNSISVSTQYNPYGSPILATDARGFQTQLIYGLVGGFTDLYPTQIKTAYLTAVQRTETRDYDFSTGLVTRVTDVDNNVSTSTIYDVFGRPTLVKAAEGKPEETRTSTEYSDVNRRVIVRFDLNVIGDGKLVAIQHYDQLGRIRLARQLEDAATQSATDETTGVKIQTRYLYSGANAYVLTSNPYRAASSGSSGSEASMGWTRSKSDNGGRVVEVQTLGGASLPAPWGGNITSTGTVATAYDANFTTVTDQAGKVRRSMIDGLGRLARIDEPDANGSLGGTSAPAQPTSYTYDALSNLIAVNQGSQTRTFVYSSLARLTSATNPESGTISYDYDNNGNLLHKTDARNITTTYVYDPLNRVTNRSYSDGTPAVTYSYDSATNGKGRLASISSSVSATNYAVYDALGRMTAGNQVTDGQTYSMSYGYNLAGNRTSMTYPSGRVIATEYDQAGRMAGVRDQQSGIFYAGAAATDTSNRVQYAAHGAVTVMKLGNGLWEHTNFNSRLQPAEIGLGTSSTNSSTLGLTNNYGSTNNNGNVQSISYSGGGLSYTQSFGYDALNRLTTSNENSGSSWSQTNGYDRYGNRWIDYGGGNQSLYFNTNNRISNAGYSYDAAGNLLADGIHTYAYDAENKVKSVDGVNDVYRYDGDGSRVRKNFTQGEQVRMVYGGGQLIAEYDISNGSLKKEYIYGAKGLIATIEPSAGTKYATADHLGSPRVITSSSGSVISRHDYLPFGEELFAGTGGRTTAQGYSASDGVRQHFTSKERDNETGLDFFEARYYSSMQGRFVSVDPFDIISETKATAETSPDKAKAQFMGYLGQPQNWNRYAYVRNNPLKYVDPTGELLELTGSDEDKKKAFERIKNLVGKEGAKYLGMVQQCTNSGHCGTYVSYTGGDTSLSSAFANTSKLNSFIGQIINSDKTVEYQIATSFDTKFQKGVFTSSMNCGGGCTVGAEESLTGNTQIFVHPDSGNIADAAFNVYANVNKVSPPGHHLDFYDDISDAHEFGHGYANAIEGLPIRNSNATNARSLEFENWQRSHRYPENHAIRIRH